MNSGESDALAQFPEFDSMIKKILDRGWVDLSPWCILSEGDARARSNRVNKRYPIRRVLCVADRSDNDDVACIVVKPGEDEERGSILIIHEFASMGWEVSARFSGFSDWFHAIVSDILEYEQASCDAPEDSS